MENLIILSGSPRGGIHSWNSMIKNLKEPLNADIAVSYGDNFELPSYIEKDAKYNWKFHEPKNWREYYEKYYSTNLINFFLRGEKYGLSGLDGQKGSGAIVFALKDIINRFHFEEIYEYKNIIYTRFDQYYFLPVNHPIDGSIYIPEGEDYCGINDRYIALPNPAFKMYFSICEYIDKIYSNFEYKLLNTESVYFEHIKLLSKDFTLFRPKRIMATVATSEDDSRWRIAKYNFYQHNDLKLKYPSEFMQAIETLLSSKLNIKYYILNLISIFQYFYLKFRIKVGLIKKFLN